MQTTVVNPPRRRAGLDVLLGRLVWLAKMHVNIDQPGNHPTAGINLLNPSGAWPSASAPTAVTRPSTSNTSAVRPGRLRGRSPGLP